LLHALLIVRPRISRFVEVVAIKLVPIVDTNSAEPLPVSFLISRVTALVFSPGDINIPMVAAVFVGIE